MEYVKIFWRTFAQLALAVLISLQGLSWATSNDVRVNTTTLGLGLLGAFIGAVVAVLWAFGLSPAAGALSKALRSAAQAAAGSLGAIVLNSVQDYFNLPTVLLASVSVIVLAFGVTFLSYQGDPPPPPPPVDD